jgi:hypothetical protein
MPRAVGGERPDGLRGEQLGHELEVCERHREGVVDLVRHARGERTGGRHPLGDDELLAHPHLLDAHFLLAQLPLDGDRQPRLARRERGSRREFYRGN